MPQYVVDQRERKCLLCGNFAPSFFDEPSKVTLCFSCAICGKYSVNDSFKYDWTDEQRALLSAYCRQSKEGFVHIGPTDIETLSSLAPHYSPPEKLDRLLQLLGERTPVLGKHADFNYTKDYPLIAANGWQEAHFLAGALLQRKLVNQQSLPGWTAFTVTMEGWNRIDSLKSTGRSLTQCFVAMAFRKDNDNIWEAAIEPAIIDAGYKPFRVDRQEHVNRIDDEIIAQIRRSRFMVADFTLQRGGVYFESGMMQGLGRNVIWMCNEDELRPEKGLHFDIRQFNFLTYNDANDGIKQKLYNRIVAIEGEGPLIKT